MTNSIWWNKISNSSRLIQDITDDLIGRKSVILCIGNEFPFYDEFKAVLMDKLSRNDARNTVTEIELEGNCNDVGKYFLEKYCSPDMRSGYFPRKNYSAASYLSECTGFQLNGSIVWIRNIQHDNIAGWCRFIKDYNDQNANIGKAIFLLELKNYSGHHIKSKNCKVISADNYYSEFDYYVYCFLLAAEIKNCNDEMKRYIAELVCKLCCGKVELCCEMFKHGLDVAKNTCVSVRNVLGEDALTENEITAIVWQVQNKLIFPVLEQFRRNLVENHMWEIKQHLPFRTPYGQEITDPFNLDLGNIKKMHKDNSIGLSPEEEETMSKYIEIRNNLAHMKPTKFDKLKYCINM